MVLVVHESRTGRPTRSVNPGIGAAGDALART